VACLPFLSLVLMFVLLCFLAFGFTRETGVSAWTLLLSLRNLARLGWVGLGWVGGCAYLLSSLLADGFWRRVCLWSFLIFFLTFLLVR